MKKSVEDRQKEFDEALTKLAMLYESGYDRDIDPDGALLRVYELRDEKYQDLDIAIITEDCIQYIRVHDYDDSDFYENPVGSAWNIEEHVLFSDNTYHSFDAGCLWGYWSAVAAAEYELGTYSKQPVIGVYDIGWESEIASRMEEEDATLTYENAKEWIMHNCPKYEGDYEV